MVARKKQGDLNQQDQPHRSRMMQVLLFGVMMTGFLLVLSYAWRDGVNVGGLVVTGIALPLSFFVSKYQHSRMKK